MKSDDAVKAWLEKSAQIWSRIQTVSVIEAGGLAGAWYSLHEVQNPKLALAIILLAGFLLVVVSLLMHRDAQYLSAFEKAAQDFPKVDPPLLGISGRWIGVALPLILAGGNFLIFCLA